jgi:hypothetical protein
MSGRGAREMSGGSEGDEWGEREAGAGDGM